jgi:multidrug efflux pump
MGIVVIGGLLFSLALTLFVIPAIYSFLSKEHKHNPEEDELSNEKVIEKVVEPVLN